MRRAAILGAALLGLIFGPAAAKDWKEVRIATEGAYKPFNYYDANKNLVGLDIDLANAVCARMKVKCTFTAQDWDGLIPGLQANKYDAIVASMSITPERKKQVDFTTKYYSAPFAFVARKGAKLADTSPAALAGKTIGAQAGTVMEQFVEEKYGKTAKTKFYRTQDEANLDLAAGRLDLVLGEKFPLYDWLQSDGKNFEIVGKDVADKKYTGEGIGIAVRKTDKDLLAMLNKALAEVRADGSYDKITKKYFPFRID
jgi:polar amino acid transport system substrate-binding protein